MTMFRKLNFWPLPKASEGRDPKNCAGACAIHVSNSHTNRAATFTKFGKRLHEFQYPKRFRLNVTSRLNFFHYADR